jgi:hypothetical protein
MHKQQYVECIATVILAVCHVSDDDATIELGPTFVGRMTAGVN